MPNSPVSTCTASQALQNAETDGGSAAVTTWESSPCVRGPLSRAAWAAAVPSRSSAGGSVPTPTPRRRRRSTSAPASTGSAPAVSGAWSRGSRTRAPRAVGPSTHRRAIRASRTSPGPTPSARACQPTTAESGPPVRRPAGRTASSRRAAGSRSPRECADSRQASTWRRLTRAGLGAVWRMAPDARRGPAVPVRPGPSVQRGSVVQGTPAAAALDGEDVHAEHDDRAEDRRPPAADVEAQPLALDQARQQVADDRADEAQDQRHEDAHLLLARDDRARDEAGDEADDDREDDATDGHGEPPHGNGRSGRGPGISRAERGIPVPFKIETRAVVTTRSRSRRACRSPPAVS